MARIRYDEEKYIYGSSRVRAVLARISAGERIWRAVEAKTLADALRIFEEFGIHSIKGNIEEALDSIIEDSYRLLGEIAPDPAVFNVLRYPYDCHNLKSAIKCSFRNTDPVSLTYNTGSLPALKILNCVREREFSALTKNMAEAAVDAYDVYYRTSDPQQIDFLIDRACYLDMTESAESFDYPYLRRFVARKADTANILTCVRLIRMHASADSVGKTILPGGEIKKELFKASFSAEGIKEREMLFYDMLRVTAYGSLKLSITDSLTAVERTCENAFLSFVNSEAKKKLYGAEVLFAFITARETEAKNLRIVIAGKSASLPAEVIKERMRTYA